MWQHNAPAVRRLPRTRRAAEYGKLRAIYNRLFSNNIFTQAVRRARMAVIERAKSQNVLSECLHFEVSAPANETPQAIGALPMLARCCAA